MSSNNFTEIKTSFEAKRAYLDTCKYKVNINEVDAFFKVKENQKFLEVYTDNKVENHDNVLVVNGVPLVYISNTNGELPIRSKVANVVFLNYNTSGEIQVSGSGGGESEDKATHESEGEGEQEEEGSEEEGGEEGNKQEDEGSNEEPEVKVSKKAPEDEEICVIV